MRKGLFITVFILFTCFVYSKHIRVLSANVGNADLSCPEYKLCDPQVMKNIKKYIQTWKPDLLLFSELLRSSQLKEIIPDEYTGICGKSVDRRTGEPAEWDSPSSSHEHECIAWRKDKLEMIPNSQKSSYGRNDLIGKFKCKYDFTGFRAMFKFEDIVLNAVVVHPNSMFSDCRVYEIDQYWKTLASNSTRTIVAGDFNAGISNILGIIRNSTEELQVPREFRTVYSNGQYWNLANFYPQDPTAGAILGGIKMWIDHMFVNFGKPCTNCGQFYGTESLPYGVVVGKLKSFSSLTYSRWI